MESPSGVAQRLAAGVGVVEGAIDRRCLQMFVNVYRRRRRARDAVAVDRLVAVQVRIGDRDLRRLTVLLPYPVH